MQKDEKEIKQDNPAFQYKIGIDLYACKQAYEEDLMWLEKSAKQGYPLAMDAFKRGTFAGDSSNGWC